MAMTLSKQQKEILVGILLGDANLQTDNGGKTYRLRVLQSEQHREYVFHLYDIFKKFVNTPPKESVYFDKRTKRWYKRWSFATTQQSCFRFYGQQFYCYQSHSQSTHRLRCSQTGLKVGNSGVKIVPKRIDKWLTPRAFTYWYMDDGAQKWIGKSLGARLCTDNFTHQEVRNLAAILHTKYGIATSTQRKGKGLRIYIKSASYEILCRLTLPQLLPSMEYKFPRPKTLSSTNLITNAFTDPIIL